MRRTLRGGSRLAGGRSMNTKSVKSEYQGEIGRCNAYSSRIFSILDLRIGLFLFLDDHGCDLGSRKLGMGMKLF